MQPERARELPGAEREVLVGPASAGRVAGEPRDREAEVGEVIARAGEGVGACLNTGAAQ